MAYPVRLGILVCAAGSLLIWMGSRQIPDEDSYRGAVLKNRDAKASSEASGGDLMKIEARKDSISEGRAWNRAIAQGGEEAQLVDQLHDERRDPHVRKPKQGDDNGYVLRSEKRKLPSSIAEFLHGDPSTLPQDLDFPLFDGQVVNLKSLRRQSISANRGVVLAKAEGEPDGGHVVLSYVGDALAGMIHLPYRGEFYEIRTAPDGSSHILTRLDPTEMPHCGACAGH